MLKPRFNEALQRAKFSILSLSLRPQVLFEGSEQRRIRYGGKSRNYGFLRFIGAFHNHRLSWNGRRASRLWSGTLFMPSSPLCSSRLRSLFSFRNGREPLWRNNWSVHEHLRSVHRNSRGCNVIHTGPASCEADVSSSGLSTSQVCPSGLCSSCVHAPHV